MCKKLSGKHERNMHGPYIGKQRNGKSKSVKYLLGSGDDVGSGDVVVLIGGWVVVTAKIFKQTTKCT